MASHSDHDHHDHDHDQHSHGHHDHGHDHGNGHGHGHHHAPPPPSGGPATAYAIGFGLNLAFVLVEAAAGIVTNSLALLADAGHNLSDLLGLALAWGAVLLSRRPPSERYTYGLRSSSIWAALINALLLLVVCGGIGWEAIDRLRNPTPIPGLAIIIVATIGVVINTATALLFMRGRHDDLNQRGVFLHMAADAAVSLGVVIAGLLIMNTGWLWLDPAISLVIVVVIIAGTWGLLKDSINLALDAVPSGIRPAEVRALLAGLPGVSEVHDLHIWAMSTAETALTAHLVMPEGTPSDAFYARLCSELERRFGIHHATVQVERGDGGEPCRLAADDRV